MSDIKEKETYREKYNPNEIEPRWREHWQKTGLYKTDWASSKPKHYAFTMFPYPSGNLHIGHWYSAAIPDTRARYMRMRGHNVFFPMGFDSFGLPAENAAIKNKADPKKWTNANIAYMMGQFERMGTMIDWDSKVVVSDPEYYRWNQWFFIQFYKKGLAYKKESFVNWDPVDQTVLANEQVIDGRGDRSGALIERRLMSQWHFKITDYAEELLDFGGMDWPERVKTMQINWIGKSRGAEIAFPTKAGNISVFTTRPDTVFGATFMVLAPEHPLVDALTTAEQKESVASYKDIASKTTDIDRQAEGREKTGVWLGSYATNPFTNEQIPVWIADYVLVTYGTGAIMAVPFGDQRDFEFARKFNLPVVDIYDIERWYMFIEEEDREIFREFLELPFVNHVINEEEKGLILVSGELHTWEKARTYLETSKLPDVLPSENGSPKTHVGGQPIFSRTSCTNAPSYEFYLPWKRPPASFPSTDYLMNLIVNSNWGKPKQITKAYDDAKRGQPWASGYYKPLINSGEFNGMLAGKENIDAVIDRMAAQGKAKAKTTYRLRDWLISRQRYWGTPIPMIYCESCGMVPEKEENLPVTLPDNVEFLPTGQSPLKVLKDWPKCKCPQCGKDAERDTDTMDTFVDSSWYFYRYLDPHHSESAINQERVKQWLPADVYSGGIEHAILHLLYTRFWTKAMRDLGLIDFGEPFRMVRNQGIILGEDNEKMSKSRGNVVDPDGLVAEYGTDTVRLYLQFMRPWDMNGPWDPRGVNGLANWLGRIWSLFLESPNDTNESFSEKDLSFAINSALKKVTEDTENFKFNTAIAAMMELTNTLGKIKRSSLYGTPQWNQTLHMLNIMLAPYAPHIAEELWYRRGYTTSVHLESWPSYDSTALVRDTVKLAVQVNGKLRAEIEVSKDADKDTILQTAKAEPNVSKHLTGEIVREIVVPGKLVNLVVKG